MKKAFIGMLAFLLLSATAVQAGGGKKKTKKAKAQTECCTKECPKTMSCCSKTSCLPATNK